MHTNNDNIEINNFSYFFELANDFISLLTLENNEFISLGSFKKSKKENITRLIHLLENNKPTLVFNESTYKHFLKLIDDSISLGIYSIVFHNYIYSKNGYHLHIITDEYKNMNEGLFTNYTEEVFEVEDNEQNIAISYVYFLRYRYLLENYDEENYTTHLEIFKSKLLSSNKNIFI